MVGRAGLVGWRLQDGRFGIVPEDGAVASELADTTAALGTLFASDADRVRDWAFRQDTDCEVMPVIRHGVSRIELVRGPVCDGVFYGAARLLEGGHGRRHFERRMLSVMMDTIREGGRCFVLLIGIRDLDTIREGIGQLAVEELFLQIERRLVHSGAVESAFRLNGNVFGLVGRCDEFDEETRATRILAQAFDTPFETTGLIQRLMGRAGLAVFPDDSASVEDLLHGCSLALSAALRLRDVLLQRVEAGRVEEMREQSLLASELLEGIVGRQFRFDLQPIVDLNTGRVVSAEALARWHHPMLGEISPSRFVPLAERQEIMVDATIAMLRRMSREVDPQSLPDMRIAVNIAPGDFNRRTVTRLANTIQYEKLLPFDRLTLEITETGLMQQDAREAFALATSLRSQNVCLAIDDFGTGYSSFGNLSALPLDILKIDRSLAQDVHQQPQKARMLAAITSMAEPLGMKTVVEGLECQEEVNTVREIGCNRVQGYVYSRPLPSAQFREFCGARAG